MGARVRASNALEAAGVVRCRVDLAGADGGSTTWVGRTRLITRAGYACYDEHTSAMLGDASSWLLERYRGDLLRLREEAGRDPAGERRLLKPCKGIREVGVDIFFREVQRSWRELYPSRTNAHCGQPTGLGSAGTRRYWPVRSTTWTSSSGLVSGLIRVDLDHAYETVAADAAAPAGRGRERRCPERTRRAVAAGVLRVHASRRGFGADAPVRSLPGEESGMSTGEVCGNDYDKSFELIAAGARHTFDSFVCAIHAVAPVCEHCGCRVIGHGTKVGGRFFCCAHCARAATAADVTDRAEPAGG